MVQAARPVNLAPAPQGADPAGIYTVKTAGAPVRGPVNAPVTIAEFSDFQCPFCQRVRPTLKQIEDVYKDKVRILWKHLPLTSIHKNAMPAALAAEAAREQGKFWEYHDKLFANQSSLEAADLKRYAQELALDMTRFEKDLLNLEKKKRVEDDMAEARALGITGTPGFFINGRPLKGAQPFEEFARVIDAELSRLKLPIPPKPVASD
jgi:protein-disulfide isomerase